MVRRSRARVPAFHSAPFFAALAAAVISTPTTNAQDKFTIEQIMSPAYCYELVGAKNSDRIAWLANESGMRNVYTAAAPDFRPVKLTSYVRDDGVDLTSLRISADGSTVVFVRGHQQNREGWIANPTSHPDGVERATWGARTDGSVDAFKVVVEDSPVLSPDGSFVVFVRDGQIYGARVTPGAKPASTDKPLFRTWGTNSDPTWSPDGSKIAFTSDRGDHSFIAVYDVAARKITYMAPSVDRDTSPTWSPDGKRIAFLRAPGLPFARAGGRADRGRGNTRERNPRFGRRGAAGGGNPRRGRGGGRGNTPKGYANAAFVGGYTLSMWVADVATATAREFWQATPGDREYRPRRITWAGDHAMFELDRKNWRHYYSVPIEGRGPSTPVELTPGEGIAEHIGLSGNGETLFYATNVGDIDRRHIWRVSTGGGKPEQISEGKGIETFPQAMGSEDRIAILSASSRQPQSVAVMSARGGEPRVIFPKLGDGFPFDEQVEPVNVVLTAADGMKFHNQVFVPKDIKDGEKRPAILFTHGGPVRQMLLGYHYRGFYHTAYAMNQWLCNRGYVVISANYRGGIGYGRDFRLAPKRGRSGNSEYQDVVAAGKYLQARPDVDPKRIGLWGLSYGGLITAQGLARNSDIFAAGVDIAGVHHWGSGNDTSNTAFRSSPIAAIDTWKSPVLLIHADDDRNVTFSQTTGLVQMLRAHRVPHEVIVYPDDVHSPLLHSRWIEIYRATDKFFAKHLAPGRRGSGGLPR